MQATGRSVFFSLSLILAVCAPALAEQRHMQLLAPDVGWVLRAGKLYWTTDGGADWADVTPPMSFPGEHLADVFFKDTSNGWALLSTDISISPEPRFELASTNDAGETWALTRIEIPDLNPRLGILVGGGSVDFVDSEHGWLNLATQSGPNFVVTMLLATQDGGRTWRREAWARAGAMRFVTPEKGWIAGGPGGEYLYTTSDGGGSWRELSLKAPPETGLATVPTYDAPVFVDEKHGYIAVTYTGAEEGVALVLFATSDGGQTWAPRHLLENVGNLGTGVLAPSAVVDSVWVAASSSDYTITLRIVPLAGTGNTVSESVRLAERWPIAREISFVSGSEGWLLGKALLATSDGGSTWTDISPGRRKSGEGAPAGTPRRTELAPNVLTSPAPLAGGGGGAPPTHTSIHVGFDKCAADTIQNMQTWWTYSPYYDTSAYIGGTNRGCSQPNLSKSWVTKVTGQGWGLLPLWVGLQAPCVLNNNVTTFSSDPATSSGQGASEAKSAEKAASGLGLSNTIIYYDMENYDTSNIGCGAAVTAFVGGWDSQLQKDGYSAGAYANPAPVEQNISQASPPPGDIWVPKYDRRATIWGLAIDGTLWTTHQRIHQYYAGPDNISGVTEKWGGVSLMIDQDIEDAAVAGGQGAKSFSSYTFTTFGAPGATSTSADGVNDASGDLSGSTGDQIVGIPGFLETNWTFASLTCPSPAVSTVPWGVNNLGHVVGTCGNANGTGSGFIYNSGASTYTVFTYPGALSTEARGINDDDQIVGSYDDSAGIRHGFVYNYGGDGSFTSFDFPAGPSGCGSTSLIGINGQGQVLGSYLVEDYPGCSANGFLWNHASDGSLVSVDYPGARNTYVGGVNANGQVAGYTTPIAAPFVYSNGTFTVFPGDPDGNAGSTAPAAINSYGRVVGWTVGADGNYHAFWAVPAP